MSWIDWLIALILAFIMLSIGLSLQRRSFQLLLARPKALLGGMFLQLLVLPALAFSVASLWDLPAAFQVGIVILAACPGGMTSNFISYLLKANTALAVSLTIANSVVTMLSVPIIINFGLQYFYAAGSEGIESLPLLPTAGRIFSIVLVPVLLGITFRAYYPLAARRWQLWFRWASMLLLALVFIIKVFAPVEAGGSALSGAEVWMILPASLVVNVLALSSGFFLGRLLGFPKDDQLTMGVEVGIQNTSLAFLIAASLLQNEDMLKPALVYATFSFLTALAYGLLLKPQQWSQLKGEWQELKNRVRGKQ